MYYYKNVSYLCTHMTASTMPDLSISIAIVVTMPVHWAPNMKILKSLLYNQETSVERYRGEKKSSTVKL